MSSSFFWREPALIAITAPTCRAAYIGNMGGAIDEDRVVAALRWADTLGRRASGPAQGSSPSGCD